MSFADLILAEINTPTGMIGPLHSAYTRAMSGIEDAICVSLGAWYGAWWWPIGMFAAAAKRVLISTLFTSSDYDKFIATSYPETGRSLATAFGIKFWTSGTFDAAALGGPSLNANDSNAYVTFVLRPA